MTSTKPQPYAVIVNPMTIRFERLLPGPVERVWAYLTESDKRGKWLAAGEMPPQKDATFDLRFDHAGLSPQAVATPEAFKQFEGGHVTAHRVVRFDPPRLLSLSWPVGGGAAESLVTFELTPQQDQVFLALTHSRLNDDAARSDITGGWHTHLAILADTLHGRDPLPFWTSFANNERMYAERQDNEPVPQPKRRLP